MQSVLEICYSASLGESFDLFVTPAPLAGVDEASDEARPEVEAEDLGCFGGDLQGP